MNAASLNPTEIILQHEQDVGYSGFGSGAGMGAGVYIPDNVSAYKLTSNDKSSEDSTVLRVFLNQKDLNALKRMEGLGTSNANTWIAMTSKTAMDMNGNALVPIDDDNAMQAFAVVKDETPPQLEAFDLDLSVKNGQAQLVLSFSETVKATTIDISKLTFNDKGINPSLSYTLSSLGFDESSVKKTTTSDGTVVSLMISSYDVNELKKKSPLGMKSSSTYLTHGDDMIKDMAGITCGAKSIGLPVRYYTEDKTPPDLLSFQMNMTSGELFLQFDEIIFPSRLVLSSAGLASSSLSGAQLYFIDTDSFRTSYDFTSVTIQIGVQDLNGIKKKKICLSKETCFFEWRRTLVEDASENLLTEMILRRPVGKYTKDTISPSLTSIEWLDLNIGTMKLHFNDVVDVTTFKPDTLVFHDFHEKSKNRITQISGEVIGSDDNYAIVKFDELPFDELKRAADICDVRKRCAIELTSASVRDMTGNQFLSSLSAIYVERIIKDTTDPELSFYSIDIEDSSITLVFNESVLASTLNSKMVSLSNNGSLSRSISLNHSYSKSSNGKKIVIDIDPQDMKLLKMNDITTTIGKTFLQISRDAIKDMTGNSLQPVTRKVPTSYNPDNSPPNLINAVLDMNSDTLSLTFNEPVRGLSSFDPKKIY
eukprot:UC4_evm1s1227